MKSLYMARICPPSSVGTIFVVVPAPSAKVSSQFVIYIYGAVRRNMQEPGVKTGHPWKSQAPPSSTLFVSRRAGNVYICVPLGTFVWPLPPLLPARQSSAWGLSHSPSVMPSTVALSNRVQSPTLRKNVQTTCSVAIGSSKAVAPSI